MIFDRAAFELRRDTFEDVLLPELTPEQRLREQIVEGVRATCPCCGYPTINGRRAYDICPLCGWETTARTMRSEPLQVRRARTRSSPGPTTAIR